MESINGPNWTRIAYWVSALVEGLHWACAAAFLVILVYTFLDPDGAISAFGGAIMDAGNELSSYGFSIGNAAMGTVEGLGYCRLFLVEVFLSFGLIAMAARDVRLIIASSEKGAEDRDPTPFNPDAIRMVGEIGIFFVSITVLQLFMAVIAVLTLDGAEVSCSFVWLVIGVMILCLRQAFMHGARLQNIDDGMI